MAWVLQLSCVNPSYATLNTAMCVRDVPVVIQRCMLLTNFVVLMMGDFNSIFIMDWLTRYRVLIDFKKKKVQHHLSRNERVTFKGKGRR